MAGLRPLIRSNFLLTAAVRDDFRKKLASWAPDTTSC